MGTQPPRLLRTQSRTIPGAGITWMNIHRRITTVLVNTPRCLFMSKPSKKRSGDIGYSFCVQTQDEPSSREHFCLVKWNRETMASTPCFTVLFSISHPRSYPTNQRALTRLRELNFNISLTYNYVIFIPSAIPLIIALIFSIFFSSNTIVFITYFIIVTIGFPFFNFLHK